MQKSSSSVKMEDFKTINILLMGETGVGKSTFINSFANYIRNKTFDDATKVDPLMLIPTYITVFDENIKDDRTLTIGSDKNEIQEAGVSATQNIKTYLFPIEGQNMVIQMIDTPGIGDTRGPDKDDENCHNIVDYLAQLDELHAICLLMKPSNDRKTALFSYCVRSIFSQLHKSAAKNVIFLFTNTKGSDYRPGDTFPVLKQTRDEIASEPPYVRIPMDNSNVFCLDNECFKHLLALNYGVKLKARTLASCRTSWEVSCEEIQRFIDHVKKLDPHNVKATVNVNHIRDLILKLSKPMSEICQLLQEKLIILTIKEDESEKSGQSLEELKQKLYKPGLDLEVIRLDNPATVCTSLSCVDTVRVGNITKYSYKNRCHDPCLLGYLTYESIGHWSIRTCSEMTWGFFPTCKHCDCSFKNHMTIFYDTKIVEKQMLDEDVQKNIDSEEVQREKLNKVIEEIKSEKKELEEELDYISTCAAKNAYYLQNNALTSSYDHFKEYIYLSLQRQKSLGAQANMEVVENLQGILERHEKLIQTLKEKKGMFKNQNITEESIQRDVEQLFQLKHTGPKLKEIFDARAACAKKTVKGTLKHIFTETIPSWFLGDN